MLIQTALLLGGGLGATAVMAQDEAEDTEEAKVLEEVVITGYRGALQNSVDAKRDTVGFSDSIFSDDIGKMPSVNLAESLARIPGVNIMREVTGEGQQIAVRGLGPDFTKIVLNGHNLSVASTGNITAGQRGRHIDLDMFPPELFSRLTVDKSAHASQIEGGVSGYVNMRAVHASDRAEGWNFDASAEASYNDMSGKTSPKVSFLGSYRNETFGALVGMVYRGHQSRVDGWETVGNFQSGCVVEWRAEDDRGCVDGSTGWNVFHYGQWATEDYAAAHPGVNVGDPIDINAVSGLTDDQLDNFGMPYIMRPMTTTGDRDTTSILGSFEYFINDDIDLTLDFLTAKADRTFEREELMHIFRRNYVQYGLEWIPENIELGDDGHILSGTFYNSRPWIGARWYEEELTFTSIMPALGWRFNDSFRMDLTASWTDSDFDRDEPYVLYYGPASTLYFAFDHEFPTVQYSQDLTQAGPGWTWGAGPGMMGDEYQQGNFRFQRHNRTTDTTDIHLDFTFGENPAANGVMFGLAYDEIGSELTNFNGNGFWENHVEGSDLLENFNNYVTDATVTDLGSSVSGYHGVNGWASLDWPALLAAVNYQDFQPEAVTGGGDWFGSVVGSINEEIFALYGEVNAEAEIAGRMLRVNAGVRWVDTDQRVWSEDAQTISDYSRILPSMSMMYDVWDDVRIKASASQSLSRANPAHMFPNVSWGSSDISQVNAGNPYLDPFESTNLDLGVEWFFGDLGYVGLTYYTKDVTGFTRQEEIQVQFMELVNYGVDITNLSATQQDSLDQCGGPSSPDCVSTVRTRVNIEGTVTLNGWEAIWVMPLDFWVEGLGFNVSANRIDQEAEDPGALITGIQDTVNATGYYENESFMARVTYYKTDTTDASAQWGAPMFIRPRAQWDLSARYHLPFWEDLNLALTFDAYNLTNEPMSVYMEHPVQSAQVFYPGTSYALGIHGSF